VNFQSKKINKPDCEELASTYTADFMPGGQYLENRSIDDDSEFEPNHTWMNLHIKSYNGNGDLKYDFYELVDKKKWNGGWNWKYYTLKKNGKKKKVNVGKEDFTTKEGFENLLLYYNPEWTENLVQYHPEYCDVLICQATSSFDDDGVEFQTKSYQSMIVTGTGTETGPINYIAKIDEEFEKLVDIDKKKNYVFSVNGEYMGRDVVTGFSSGDGYEKFIDANIANYRLANVSATKLTIQEVAKEQAMQLLNVDNLTSDDNLHAEYYWHFLKNNYASLRGIYLSYVKIILKHKISSIAGCKTCSDNIQ
jgi:hypothetical protein